MVTISRSPYEGAPKSIGPNLQRDLSADSTSDQMHASLMSAQLESEITRLQSLEPAGFDEIPITSKMGRRGKTALNATYFRSKNPTSPVPIGINAGLGATDDIYWRLATETANLGRDAYVLEPPRHQDLLDILTWEHMSDVLLLQMQAVHAMKKVLHSHPDVIEARGSDGPVTEVDLGLHSLANNYGVRSTLYDAQNFPDAAVKTRSLIALMGAGLDGKEGVQQVIHHGKGLPAIVKKSIYRGFPKMRENNASRDIVGAEAEHVKDVVRLCREMGHIILRPQVGHHIIKLRELGVHYAAIVGREDEIFDDEDVEATSGAIVDMMHFIDDADHTTPNTDPDFANHLVGVSNVLNREQLRDVV